MKSKTWALAFLATTVAIALGLGWTLRPSQAELPEREDAVVSVPEARPHVELEAPLREPAPAATSRTEAIPPDAPAPKPRDEDDVRANLDRLIVDLRASGQLDPMADPEMQRIQAALREVQVKLRRGELELLQRPQLPDADVRKILESVELVLDRPK